MRTPCPARGAQRGAANPARAWGTRLLGLVGGEILSGAFGSDLVNVRPRRVRLGIGEDERRHVGPEALEARGVETGMAGQPVSLGGRRLCRAEVADDVEMIGGRRVHELAPELRV